MNRVAGGARLGNHPLAQYEDDSCSPRDSATPVDGPSALETLRQRYARGEIDTATFEQMRAQLEASGVGDEQPSAAHR